MTDILERLRNFDGTRTHWDGCEESHTICAAHAEIVRLRKQVEALRALQLAERTYDIGRYQSARAAAVACGAIETIPAIPPETPGGNGLPSEATGRK